MSSYLLEIVQTNVRSTIKRSPLRFEMFRETVWGSVGSPEGPGLQLQHPEVTGLRQAAVVEGVAGAAPAQEQRLVQPQSEVTTEERDESGRNGVHPYSNKNILSSFIYC